MFNAIKSALTQHTGEFFIWSYCSTDDSLSISNKFSHRDRYIVVDSQENNGPRSVRNKGVELSQGKYIMFLDSDDYLHW